MGVCVGRGLFKSVECEEGGRYLKLEVFNVFWRFEFFF